jgi:hypothetical protein
VVNQISFVSIYVGMVLALEIALLPLPNVQLTFTLLTVFVLNFSFKESFLVILSYNLIKTILWGMNIITLAGFIGWLSLLLFKKIPYNYLTVVIVSILVMLAYAPFNIILYNLPVVSYFVADAPFTLIFVVSNVITLMWLKGHLNRVVKGFKKYDRV